MTFRHPMLDYRFSRLAGVRDSVRWALVLSVTVATILMLFFLPRITQDQAYHHFADDRTLLGIANFWNVVSNIPFMFIGVCGFILLRKQWKQDLFSDWYELVPYVGLFFGIFLTAFGSAYYHSYPDDGSIVWDRIPMTVIFMSFISIVLLERLGHKTGFWLFWLILLLGMGSVAYWRWTSIYGVGDLRYYAWIQFYSPVFVVLILYLFPEPFPPVSDIAGIFMIYALAKVCEYFDYGIYRAMHVFSGHTVKHFVAAASLLWVLIMISKRKHQVVRAVRD